MSTGIRWKGMPATPTADNALFNTLQNMKENIDLIIAYLEAQSSTSSNLFGFAYCRQVSTIPASTEFARFDSKQAWVLKQSLPKCNGKVDGAPTAQTDFDIRVGGASVGTMRFPAGVTTANFLKASDTSVPAGTSVSVVSPSVLNGMSGLLDFSIIGVR